MYFKYKSKSRYFYLKNEKNNAISEKALFEKIKFQPTFLIPPSGHFQTVFPEIIKKKDIDLRFVMEFLSLDDGGEVCLAWHDADGEFKKETPICVVLHGLAGSHESYYIKYLIRHVYEVYGWRCVVFNARGSGESVLKTKSMFHAGFTEDIYLASRYIREKNPHSPMVTIAYSLGGNILTNYLGKHKSDVPYSAAVSISNPCNLPETNRQMNQPLQRITYARFLVQGLLDYFRTNESLLSQVEGVDRDEVLRSKTVFEFDRAIVIKSAGYKTVSDYYDDASSSKRIHAVEIPLLSIMAEDDPISSFKGMPFELAQTNPNLFFLLTKTGGHMGWMEGFNISQNNTFSDNLAGRFLNAVIETST